MSKIYNNCIFNKIILLEFSYLIIENKFFVFNLDFKIKSFIKLYKYKFFKNYLILNLLKYIKLVYFLLIMLIFKKYQIFYFLKSYL